MPKTSGHPIGKSRGKPSKKVQKHFEKVRKVPEPKQKAKPEPAKHEVKKKKYEVKKREPKQATIDRVLIKEATPSDHEPQEETIDQFNARIARLKAQREGLI